MVTPYQHTRHAWVIEERRIRAQRRAARQAANQNSTGSSVLASVHRIGQFLKRAGAALMVGLEPDRLDPNHSTNR